LRFPPLNLFQRIRFGLGALYIQRSKGWKNLENITAHHWLPKMVGKKGYQVIFQPLLRSKFGSSYQKISAAWFWRKINDRSSTRSGSDKKEELGYLKGSFGRLIEAIADDIQKNGGKIYPKTPVEKILIKNGRAEGLRAAGKNYYFDQIISTVHFDISRIILKNKIAGKLNRALAKISYQGVVVMVLQLKYSLSPYYWINVCDADIPFVAVIEHTNLLPKSDYQNKNLVYLSNYISPAERLYRLSDHELLQEYIIGLRKIFPKFRREWVEKFKVFRSPFASPIFVKNYSKLIPAQKSPIKNLYLVNIAQIYPADRGTDKSILQAEEFVKKFF
jgi:protoporphyrinogen oxidase